MQRRITSNGWQMTARLANCNDSGNMLDSNNLLNTTELQTRPDPKKPSSSYILYLFHYFRLFIHPISLQMIISIPSLLKNSILLMALVNAIQSSSLFVYGELETLFGVQDEEPSKILISDFQGLFPEIH